MFRTAYYQYQVGFVPEFLNTGVHAHSLLLNVWAETGTLAVIGLGSLISITMLAAYNLFRSNQEPIIKAIALGLFAGLLGYIVSASLFGTVLAHFTTGERFFSSETTIYLFMILGLTVALTRVHVFSGRMVKDLN